MRTEQDKDDLLKNIQKLRAPQLGSQWDTHEELAQLNQPIPMQEQNTLQVKIKKLHKDAVIPKYAALGDAGLDLVATSIEYADDTKKPYSELGTGIAVEIPEGYVGLVFPRSSISKTIHTLANSVGVIDSGYRGEIKFRFFYSGTAAFLQMNRILGNLDHYGYSQVFPTGESTYNVGDKIGQLIILPYPKVSFVEVEELTETARGTNGYGSTGK